MVTALGEILIDYTPKGISENGMQLFEQNAGGAPANVLSVVAKCGAKAAFIGKVGNDMQGLFLKQTLEKSRIKTSNLIIDDKYFTTLAFVTLGENGERSFAFARKPGADTKLTKDEVKSEILEKSKIFHFGSLSLTHEPAASATLYAIKKAKKMGSLISYDPNYRAPLWESEEIAKQKMKSVIKYVDIMKVSDEETVLLTGETDPQKACENLIAQGVRLVVVTLGDKGAFVMGEAGTAFVPSFTPTCVKDTTGAGDAFWGGFLYRIHESTLGFENLTLKKLEEYTRFANAVASLCIEKYGAIPAMPSVDKVLKRIKENAN
ncbi:MAG: carbohydrate kinase [Clostridia bacterium]